MPTSADTADAAYARRLQGLQQARWKRVLDVQAPYRWHIRHLQLGRVLDIGCGIGRNLAHLGSGVGVDHNAAAVAIARSRGLTAHDAADWARAPEAVTESFDTLLLAHVVEHMSEAQALDLVRSYRAYLKPGGRVVFITPQERGFATDATHVRFVGFAELDALATALDLEIDLRRSFPFPRAFGRVFAYNEFVAVGRLRTAG